MTNRTDTFDRADSTSSLGTPSDGGAAWSVLQGTFGISSNKAYESANTNLTAAVLESSVADVDVQVTLSTVSSTCGLIARAANSVNYLLCDTVTGVGLRMFKYVAGSFTSLGSYGTAASSGDVLKFRCSGSSLTLYQNGVSRITATDSAGSTNTKHGIRTHYDTSSRFDDFSITELTAAIASLVYYQPAIAPLLVR